MYDVICKFCSTKLSQFMQTGMLGCPHCYKAFESEIASNALRLHGKNVHVGKTPEKTDEDKILLDEYKKLSQARDKAVIERRFDDVNLLSRKIFAISEELKRRGII